MPDIGKWNRLKVKKEVDFGIYLDSDAGEILVPRKYVPQETKPGDMLDVFVYRDSEDRIIATTLAPLAVVGEFAYLKVKEVTKIGAFLDWGIEKDLLVPYSELERKMERGKNYIVRLFLHEKTDRVTASAKIAKFIEHENIELHEGEPVDLMVCNYTDLGVKVIVNNKYYAMLFKDELFSRPAIGEKLKGFVKRIREDKKIDVSLKKGGYEDVVEAKEIVLSKLRKAVGGFLPLHDGSDPELIRSSLGMSKKAFKKAVGGLYKDGLIDLRPDGIKLIRNEDKKKRAGSFKFE